jgi:hypothetical protein
LADKMIVARPPEVWFIEPRYQSREGENRQNALVHSQIDGDNDENFLSEFGATTVESFATICDAISEFCGPSTT